METRDSESASHQPRFLGGLREPMGRHMGLDATTDRERKSSTSAVCKFCIVDGDPKLPRLIVNLPRRTRPASYSKTQPSKRRCGSRWMPRRYDNISGECFWKKTTNTQQTRGLRGCVSHNPT